jgi:ADP-heptose:LPS heptosyltransferase
VIGAHPVTRPVAQPVALVLRALGLGDLLAGVPALRALRAALPGHHLALATDPALAPLVELVGGIDELVPARGLAPLQVEHAYVDVAVDLHGKGPLSQPVLQALRPGHLVAFGCEEVGVEGPRWRRDEHERERWCRLVAEALQVPADPADLRLPVPETEPLVRDAVVVHPGAAFESRRWPAERFAAVAAGLAADGHRVVVTGSPGEGELASTVAAGAGLPAGAVLAGRTDVGGLAALVAHARLVVSGDTGTAHLASAFATPSVLLFGPTPPAWWGPPADGPHTVLWHGDPDLRRLGDPWGDRPDPALLRINVDQVLSAASGSLKEMTSA